MWQYRLLVAIKENLHESCLCIRFKSINRQRQLAYVLCKAVKAVTGKKIGSIRGLALLQHLVVYNTEASGALHYNLVDMKQYSFSEYFGQSYKSGEMVNGILNEDLMDLSFKDETFDLVLSSDVLEHVPDPYKAHREIYRVLKPNGRHVFTVPFYQTEFLDETRATHDENGELRLIKESQYHSDPLRPDGALVYTIFSLQMLVEMRKIGFRTNLYHLYKPWYGILGANAIVFEAIKV